MLIVLTMVAVKEGALQTPSWAMADGSGLAAATNGNRTVSFLFWRGIDGKMRQANVILQNDGPGTVTTASVGSETVPGNNIAAAWLDNGNQGPLVAWEEPQGNLKVSMVNWNAKVLWNATLYE